MLFATRAVADEAVASSSFWPFFFFEETSAHLEGLKLVTNKDGYCEAELVCFSVHS